MKWFRGLENSNAFAGIRRLFHAEVTKKIRNGSRSKRSLDTCRKAFDSMCACETGNLKGAGTAGNCYSQRRDGSGRNQVSA